MLAEIGGSAGPATGPRGGSAAGAPASLCTFPRWGYGPTSDGRSAIARRVATTSCEIVNRAIVSALADLRRHGSRRAYRRAAREPCRRRRPQASGALEPCVSSAK